jgi:hypothetical protein
MLEKCRPENLATVVGHLLAGDGEAQVAAMRPSLEAMGLGGPPPSVRTANAVLEIIADARAKKA